MAQAIPTISSIMGSPIAQSENQNLFQRLQPTTVYYSSQHWIEPFATGKIRQNHKFADFWCVFFDKKKR